MRYYVSRQTEKNSLRAYVFRFALELGHCSLRSALRISCARGWVVFLRIQAHSVAAVRRRSARQLDWSHPRRYNRLSEQVANCLCRGRQGKAGVNDLIRRPGDRTTGIDTSTIRGTHDQKSAFD